MENRNLKIGVIGLGLIGGSVLKALHKYRDTGLELIAVSKSSHNKAKEFCDVSSPDMTAVKGCDIVFVCSKMSETLDVLEKLQNIVKPECIVTDVSSLKRFVNKKTYKYNFIGSHPMAGTEFSGFEHSFDTLFKGAKWVLNRRSETLENLILKMGATPVVMDENTHDKYTCLISHLPMLISTALFYTAYKNDKECLKLASSGFRDTTRLSLTNPSLACDMLGLNSDNFNIITDEFIQNLNELKNMPKTEFTELLGSIQEIRSKMYDKDGKNSLC